MYIKNEKNIQGNCSVCGHPVMVDEIGNGDVCANCGWEQDAASADIPNLPSQILITLNKAKELYKQGKPFKVDFDDFIKAYKMYGEMEFYYNQMRYGMIKLKEGKVEFFDCDTEKYYVIFQSIEEFIEKASINGRLIKDIWGEVENPYWLQ